LKTIKQSKGFTIIELLLGILIAMFIAASSAGLLRTYYDNFSRSQKQLDQQSQNASSLEKVTKYLRQAQSIESAANQDLIIYAYYYPTDPAPDRLHFAIANENLTLGVIRPSGEAPDFTYLQDSETTQIIATNLANDQNPIFKYYDLNGILLTSPPNPAAIKMVEINLWIGAGSGITLPPALLLSTKVSLRNLKNNL